MSNWVAITEDTLKAEGYASIIDGARTQQVGATDPVPEKIADAIATVRRAVSVSNVLDADPTKVPTSLRAIAVRIALYALMQRIGYPLSQDDRDTRRADQDELKRIADKEMKIKVETPDVPAASAEMQATGGAIEAICTPPRLTGRDKLSGL